MLASPAFGTPVKQPSQREEESHQNNADKNAVVNTATSVRNPDSGHAGRDNNERNNSERNNNERNNNERNNNEHDGSKGFERRTQRALSESPLNISSSSKFSPRKGGMLAARIALLDAQEERNLRRPGVSVHIEHDSDSSSGSPVSKQHIRGNVGGRLDRLAATVDDLLRD
jgi:hypothetical protein